MIGRGISVTTIDGFRSAVILCNDSARNIQYCKAARISAGCVNNMGLVCAGSLGVDDDASVSAAPQELLTPFSRKYRNTYSRGFRIEPEDTDVATQSWIGEDSSQVYFSLLLVWTSRCEVDRSVLATCG